MGQISMEKPALPGSVLSGNQQRRVLPTCLMVPTRPMRVNSAILRIVFLSSVGLCPVAMAIRSWPGRRNRAGAARGERRASAALRPGRSHEFWRRRRMREECRSGSPLAGETGRGKFLAPGADVPSTAIGIQPCNRERQPEQGKDLRSSPAPGSSADGSKGTAM